MTGLTDSELVGVIGSNRSVGNPLEASRQPIELGAPQVRYALTTQSAREVETDCVVVHVPADGRLSSDAAVINNCSDRPISKLIEEGLFQGTLGTTFTLAFLDNVAARTVVLVGSGKPGLCRPHEFRKLVKCAYTAIAELGVRAAAMYLADIPVTERGREWRIREQITAIEDSAYRYERRQNDESMLQEILVNGEPQEADAVFHGRAFAAASNTARRLGDTPPNICTPMALAEATHLLAEQYSTITSYALGEAEILQLGMSALLSVGQGSRRETQLAVAYYSGTAKTEKPIVLIGKGVTFDTGGTTVKTREAMRLMKYDMAGAAAIIGVLHATAMLELPINLVVIAPCAENMPDGNATRPSDTVRSMSGKVVEILNPDAEGRLLLCDALTYAERFDPELVIDVATLTGASLIALGRHFSAMFTASDDLAEKLEIAGRQALDKVWRLPLSSEDMTQLDSDFADIANIGDGTAGCGVAALFLSRFAAAYPWVHIDVSGTAKKQNGDIGATGRPTALLLQFLLNRTGRWI